MQAVRISRAPADAHLSDSQARDLVAGVKWYHRFELRPGLMTPGVSDFGAKAAADSLKIPADLHGKRVLDVGAWDGPLTFELERRGAEAFALDVQDPTRVGFDVARRVLGSRAVHYEGSVYQLPCEDLHDLDLIVARGVYYHLKHPILAFERLAAALKLGGTLHFEGEGLLNYAEDLDGKPVNIDFAALNKSNAPLCLVYPNSYKGASNWFIPSPAALRAFMQAAGLDVVEMNTWTSPGKPPGQRLYGYAAKVRETSELLEHPLY